MLSIIKHEVTLRCASYSKHNVGKLIILNVERGRIFIIIWIYWIYFRSLYHHKIFVYVYLWWPWHTFSVRGVQSRRSRQLSEVIRAWFAKPTARTLWRATVGQLALHSTHFTIINPSLTTTYTMNYNPFQLVL